MKNPFKPNPVDRARKQIVEVETALAELQKRRHIVEKMVDENKAKLRAFVRDNPTADPPAELRQYVIVSREDLEATTDTIAELEQQITELRGSLAAEEDKARREAEAKRLEAAADGVDVAADDLRKATAAVAAAAAKMQRALPKEIALVESRSWARLPGDRDPHRDAYTAEELVAAVVAEALASVRPSLFVERSEPNCGSVALLRMSNVAAPVPAYRLDGPVEPAVENGAELLISRRLRSLAATIRSGGDLKKRNEPTDAPNPPAPNAGDVEIFVTSPIAYAEDASGRRRLLGGRWVHRVPDAVAEEAVARGLAHRTDTPEGRATFDKERAYRETSMSSPSSSLCLEDCEDLGDPCGFIAEAAE